MIPLVIRRASSSEKLISRIRFKIVRLLIRLLNPIITISYKSYSYLKRLYEVGTTRNLNELPIQEEDSFLVDWLKFIIVEVSLNRINSYTMDLDLEIDCFGILGI